jgi:hypothetical protein
LGESVEVSKSLVEDSRELTREEKEEKKRIEQLEEGRIREINSMSPPPSPALKQHETRSYEHVGTRHRARRVPLAPAVDFEPKRPAVVVTPSLQASL